MPLLCIVVRKIGDEKAKQYINTTNRAGHLIADPGTMRLYFTHCVARWYQSHCQKAAALAQPAA
jgi:hypothetical protein